MDKWPCDECIVKAICNTSCEPFLFLKESSKCIDVTINNDDRYRFIYNGNEVYGPYLQRSTTRIDDFTIAHSIHNIPHVVSVSFSVIVERIK